MMKKKIQMATNESYVAKNMVLQLISLKNCRTSSVLLPSLSSSWSSSSSSLPSSFLYLLSSSLSSSFSTLLLLCADWELKLVPRPSIALKPKGLLHNFPSFFFSLDTNQQKIDHNQMKIFSRDSNMEPVVCIIAYWQYDIVFVFMYLWLNDAFYLCATITTRSIVI